MIDHLGIQCSDVAASAAFYDRVLAPLGASRLMEPHPGVIGYGTTQPDFWLGPLSDSHTGWREDHIAFQAPDRAAVRAFFDGYCVGDDAARERYDALSRCIAHRAVLSLAPRSGEPDRSE